VGYGDSDNNRDGGGTIPYIADSEQEVVCKLQDWTEPALAYCWTQLWKRSQGVEVGKRVYFKVRTFVRCQGASQEEIPAVQAENQSARAKARATARTSPRHLFYCCGRSAL
jgi:hypothetical protein